MRTNGSCHPCFAARSAGTRTRRRQHPQAQQNVLEARAQRSAWHPVACVDVLGAWSSTRSDGAEREDVGEPMNISLDSDTDVSDYFESCNHTTTDVEWLDTNLPDAIRGQYQCKVLNSGICNHSHVTLDPAELNIGIDDDEDTTKTACHEAGHSVGLTHVSGGSDCMRNGELPFPDEIYYTFNTHHISHINGAF